MCGASVSPNVTDLQSSIVNDNFVETGLDEATSDMFELLSSLYQQTAASSGKLDGNAFPSVPCPNVKSGVSRPPMDR